LTARDGIRDPAAVTWLHLTASTFFGGPERQMLGLARHLPPGVRPLFASFSEAGRCRSFLAEVRSNGFEAIELANDFPHAVRVIRELVELILRQNVDLLYTHTYKPNLLGGIAAKLAGVPHVVVSRGWTGESRKVRAYEFLDRVNLRFADRVVAVSQGQAAKVKRCAVPANRLMVIRNAARLAKSSTEAPAGSPTILAAGRLSPEKGFDVLIDAAMRLPADARVAFYGDGPERAALQARIDRAGLSDRVTLHGFTAALDDLMPTADLVVLPSRTEGLPNVALEAAAAGRPIVATAVGGTPEIVRHGVNGWLVPPDDPATLADRIVNLLNDPTRRDAFGRAGRAIAETEFSFEAQAKSYSALADDLVPRVVPFAPPRPKTRIAFVIDELSRAGTETQLLALIRGLDRSRFEPSLVLLRGDVPDDIPGVSLGVTKLLSGHGLHAARRLRALWRADRPDRVVSYFLDASHLALPVAASLRIPTVRVRNNLGYWQSAKHRIIDRLLRPITGTLVTNSDAGRDNLIGAGERADRIRVVENGVDLDRFSVTIPPVAPIRIGCVANLRPVKNVDGLIRAVAAVPKVELHVAGDGPDRSGLEQLIRDRELTDCVTLHGSVADIPAFLAACSFVVLPSHSESLSNALLEAMAAGRTTIATDVGANRRVLGDAGLIVPSGDDPALAAAIRDLAGDPIRIRDLGRRARDRVAREFGRGRMIADWERLLTGDPAMPIRASAA
jgi:glycosyltransferase involved in cell wall biosynthesis